MLILEIEGPGFDGVEARAIPADVPDFTIGRGAENDLTLADPSRAVSKRHCIIRAEGGAIVLEDISTNGTRLDGVTVSMRVATLRQGSVIEIGPYRITITLAEAGDTDAGGAIERETMRILASLTPREERVLRMRFGIGAEPGHSVEEVGEQFSVTRERIREIEAKALRKLRGPRRSRKLRSFLDEPDAAQVDEGAIVDTDRPASGAAPPPKHGAGAGWGRALRSRPTHAPPSTLIASTATAPRRPPRRKQATTPST